MFYLIISDLRLKFFVVYIIRRVMIYNFIMRMRYKNQSKTHIDNFRKIFEISHWYFPSSSRNATLSKMSRKPERA